MAIYERLLVKRHFTEDAGQLDISQTGLEFFAAIGANTEAILAAKRSKARPCLDWTQRRHHLAGAAGRELLNAFTENGWITPGNRPRSVRITEIGRQRLPSVFGLAKL